jgi:hypothetical protein
MIEEIRIKIEAGLFEFTKHAVDQSILRHISLTELRESIALCYEPDPGLWEDFKVRKI